MVAGVLDAGDKLPSVRELAAELAINPNTIQRAYMQLEQDGYIYTVVGRGNYVTDRSDWQKGFQTAAKQELTEALGKARSSGLSLEEVLKMAKKAYDGPGGPPTATNTPPANNETKDANASSKEE
jgi:GntR family transcriptional regulator